MDEIIEKNNNFLNNHKDKCRCCFKYFTEDNKKVQITKIQEERFFEVTQMELKRSRTGKYSQFICNLCNNDLEGFTQFKTDSIIKQKVLYEVVDGVIERPKRQRNEIIYFDEPELQSTPQIKLEPKEEYEDYQIKECSVVIEPYEPFVKTEVIEIEDQIKIPDHFYHSEASSEDLIETVFKNLPVVKKKRKCGPKSKKVKHPCTVCGKVFDTNNKLQKHLSLEGHIQRVHPTTDTTEKKKDLSAKIKSQCPQCGILVIDIKSHLRQNHRPRNHECDVCGYRTYRIREHVWRHLSKDTKLETDGINCEQCGKIFISRGSLKSHMRNKHSGDEQKIFSCFCGKTYNLKNSFKIHQQTAHRPDERRKNFICKLCNKSFLHNQSLKDHYLIHERKSDKNATCQYCGKMYACEESLKQHMIFHTEPKHKCPYCDKKYHRNCMVTRHIKSQHENQTSECEYCGKTLNIFTLSKHVREFHSGIERLPCPIPGCKSAYARKSNLKDHIKRMHKDYMNNLTPEGKSALHEKIEELHKKMI